jgi:hypothetical protein
MTKRRQNFQNIAWFYDLYKRGHLEMTPPYQRRSVWNSEYREQFINTILLDYPAPAIILFARMDEKGTTHYDLVDGKQRLMAVFDFADNKFPVGESCPITDLAGRFFKDLPGDNKIAFFEYDFSVEYLPTNNETVINTIFDRLNRNVAKLTAQELRHARFGGMFITQTENLTEWIETQFEKPFPRISPASKRQMKDVEIVATLLLFLEEGTKGFSVLQLDEEFSERDKEWEKELETTEEFRRVVQSISALVKSPEGQFLPTSRFRNQADFYSLFGAFAELMRDSHLESNPAVLAERLKAFLEIVDNDFERLLYKDAVLYYDAARSASNDPTPRRDRINIVKNILQGDQLVKTGGGAS